MTPPAPDALSETVATFQSIDDALPDCDGLKWFNRLCLLAAEAARARIGEGRLKNPAWIAGLEVRWAGSYFDALEAWQASGQAPGCWRALFERRGEGAIARIQFALAGLNARLNHDLPMAIVGALADHGTSPVQAGELYGDYAELSLTLAGVVDQARREWMVRLPGDPLPPLSHLESTLAAWSARAAREAAWTNAELLWDVREIPLMAGRYLDVIDGLATVAGKALLAPVPIEEPSA